MAEPMGATLTQADCDQLSQRGIRVSEAQRQLALLADPPPHANLVRACTRGDGIEQIDASLDEHVSRWERAADSGRATKFVPASGAATRMFQDLIQIAEGEACSLADLEGSAAGRFLHELKSFPFFAQLEPFLADGSALDSGDVRPVLRAVLDEPGLGLRNKPKGLVPFHAYDDRARTALEEQLVEAEETVRDARGVSRIHFTVSPEHEAGFRQLCEQYERRTGAQMQIGFSHQSPSTDTLALDENGRPFRDADGRLLFRPGGHGALIENLAALDADVVTVKNIDNVVPDRHREQVSRWKKALGGYFVALQDEVYELCRELEGGASSAAKARATQLVRDRFGDEAPGGQAAEQLLARLNRPLRVCGMVENLGEPGGGPFWVRAGDGNVSCQIVEGAQIDPNDTEQQQIRSGATHFNPVDLICGLRDHRGQRFDLGRFVDEQTSFVADKSRDGRALRALERPGLWNGAMAGWNTVFVEVPAATFAPVKTVLDLLREEHRA